MPVVAFDALATGFEVAEEGGCDIWEAVRTVGGAPRIWHGVERGVGDDAIEREGMAEEVVGGVGLCGEGFEDVVLLAEQSPKEVSILQCGEYAHGLLCRIHFLFPGLGEAALEALDLGLFPILLLLEVLKLVKGGNMSGGKVTLDHCRDGFSVGVLRKERDVIGRGRGARVVDGGRGELAGVRGVSLAISGGYLGEVGLNAIRNVGSDHEAGGGDGGVRDDDLVKVCGQGVV